MFIKLAQYIKHPVWLWPVVLVLLACDSEPLLKPLSQSAVILSFGDSLTFGTGATTQQAYPAKLQELISRTVINAGIPGEVTQSALYRLPELLKRHQPDLLILCHGGNDILRHYDLKQTKENLQQMINLAKVNNTQVLLIGVPQFGIFLDPAPFYDELAQVNQLPIENEILSSILKSNKLKSDQIHPNAEGYALMAERIQALLISEGAL